MSKPTHNPFQFAGPITVDSLAELFDHHRSLTGGWGMTAGPGEPDPAAAAAAAAAATQAAADQAARDAAAATAARGGAKPEALDDQQRPLGYPVDTPVSEMTEKQEAAYWRNNSRRHENRSSEWLKMFDGKKPEEIQAELKKYRESSLSDSERAVEDAKAETRKTTLAEVADSAATMLLENLLEHVDADRRKVLIDNADLTKLRDENGKLDTAKVKALAQALAPSSTSDDKSTRRTSRVDYGGGRRTQDSGSGVAAGRDLFTNRRGKSTDTTTS